MVKKASRFRRIRETAQTLLDERALRERTQHSKLHRFAHFWVMVFASFTRNRCPVRASALAYATILALIPMLAVVVSITSSLLKSQGEESIDNFIVKLVSSVTPPAMVGTNQPTRLRLREQHSLTNEAYLSLTLINESSLLFAPTNAVFEETN